MRSCRPKDLGSAGMKRDNLALPLGLFPCSLWLDGLLTEIPLPSLAPLCFLADELDHRKLFSAPGKTLIYTYSF